MRWFSRCLVRLLRVEAGYSRIGLAQALSTPTIRVAGVVSAARRVLNLDQAQVVGMEGDDVVLDERLLRVQFGLGNGR